MIYLHNTKRIYKESFLKPVKILSIIGAAFFLLGIFLMLVLFAVDGVRVFYEPSSIIIYMTFACGGLCVYCYHYHCKAIKIRRLLLPSGHSTIEPLAKLWNSLDNLEQSDIRREWCKHFGKYEESLTTEELWEMEACIHNIDILFCLWMVEHNRCSFPFSTVNMERMKQEIAERRLDIIYFYKCICIDNIRMDILTDNFRDSMRADYEEIYFKLLCENQTSKFYLQPFSYEQYDKIKPELDRLWECYMTLVSEAETIYEAS